MLAVYNDHGVRFQYPADWELEVTDDGTRTTVAVGTPDGLTFALISLDEDRPAPADMADEALDAMREEYPALEAAPAIETIDDQSAVGHDVEFLSLDLTNSCAIRSFRTPRRTVLVFAQWSDLNGDESETQLRRVRASIAETDA